MGDLDMFSVQHRGWKTPGSSGFSVVLRLHSRIFLSSSLNKATEHETKPKVLPSRVCVCATFFLAHSTSQKTWSQTSCHGSTVGTADVAQVHTSQPHPHWQMPLTSNTRRVCLLPEQRCAVSTVASQQDISECRCQFLPVLSVSEAFFSSALQAPSQICLVFTFSCTRVCKHSHLQKPALH